MVRPSQTTTAPLTSAECARACDRWLELEIALPQAGRSANVQKYMSPARPGGAVAPRACCIQTPNKDCLLRVGPGENDAGKGAEEAFRWNGRLRTAGDDSSSHYRVTQTVYQYKGLAPPAGVAPFVNLPLAGSKRWFCEPGPSVPHSGAVACGCQPGRYVKNTGSGTCERCPGGSYVDDATQTCQLCAAGQQSLESVAAAAGGAAACTDCPMDHFSEPRSTSREACILCEGFLSIGGSSTPQTKIS